MDNNYMYAIDRSDEYLAHYGIKGMKWGVRKAIASGNSRALARQYRKASRKLAKLQRQASSGKKYARRAAALGAGAAIAGGAAAAGLNGIGTFVKNNAKYAGKAVRGAGGAMVGAGQAISRIPGASKVGGRLVGAGYTMQSKGNKVANAAYMVGNNVHNFGNKTAFTMENATSRNLAGHADRMRKIAAERQGAAIAGKNVLGNPAGPIASAKKFDARANAAKTQVTNNTLARVGAGALAAGLAGAAGYNAYRAATTKKAAKRAEEFQREMNKAFKGTKYANQTQQPQNKSKKRRRR